MKIFKTVLLGLCIVVCLVFLILFFTQMFKMNKTDVSVSQEIVVSSSVNNVIQQTYTSTITGAVKNNTDKVLNDVKIIISVETTALNHKGTFTIDIGTMQAGEEIYINDVRATEENFEKVKEVRYQVADGEKKYVVNGDGVAYNLWAILYLLPTLLFAYLSIKVAKSLRWERRKRSVVAANPTPQPTKDDTLTYIIAQQQENERRRIELESQRVKVDLTRAEFEQQKEVNARPRYCGYCGTKNDANAPKCVNCGSTME